MKIIPVILLIAYLLFSGCEVNGPQIQQNVIKIIAVDKSVKEAYLHIGISDKRNDEEIILRRDGKDILRFKASVKDTIVVDSLLSGNTTYRYTAIGKLSGKNSAASNEVIVTTLAPTSHEYTWQTFSFGDYDDSYLTDITIINENDIWAVGKIMLNDSTGNRDYQIYGAVHWNGKKWEKYKIAVRDYYYAKPYPCTIFSVFSVDGEIYLTNGSTLALYYKGSWYEKEFFDKNPGYKRSIGEMWAKDKSDLYCVGADGSIFHLSGGTIKMLPYESDESIIDVWGTDNIISGKTEVYCTSVSQWYDRTSLIKITDGNTITETKWEEKGPMLSTWTNRGFPIYAGGRRFYENSRNRWNEISFGNDIWIYKIKGNALNDILITGEHGMVGHFNGEGWNIQTLDYYSTYYSLDIKGNTIALVGCKRNKAIVTIGKR